MSALQSDRPGHRPLYKQVRELLLARIASGAWRPADALPSEQALALELGVSQGTVRKALDSLAADSLVERRQGKGTYVSQHTQESAHFRFFRLNFDGSRRRATPACKSSTISKRRATKDEQAALSLSAHEDVYFIVRTRTVDDVPVLLDEICVAAALMTDLDAHHPLPNTLYTFYQETYGASIIGASEEIKAVMAKSRQAKKLELDVGAPLLLVERRGFGLNNQPLEYRKTYYNTQSTHYSVDLT